MKYQLKSHFKLRNWQNETYILFDFETKKSEKLKKAEFQILKFFISGLDDNLVILFPYKKIIDYFLQKNVIEKIGEDARKENTMKQENYEFYNCQFIEHVHWSITKNCNLKCKHCYMSAPNKKYKDLTFSECKSIIEGMNSCGISSISLTGGEPFVRSDFWRIIDFLIEKNIDIKTIYTNGFVLNQTIIDNFKIRKISPIFSLSFDGIAFHDFLRGVRGAEKKAIDALKLLNKNNFKTECEVCVCEKNSHNIFETISLLSSFGVNFIKIGKIQNIGNWDKYGKNLSISDEKIYEMFLNLIPLILKNYVKVNLQLSPILFYDFKNKNLNLIAAKSYSNSYEKLNEIQLETILERSVCEHAKNVMYINSKGETLPCVILDSVNFKYKISILKNGFLKALKKYYHLNSSSLKIKNFFKKNKKCDSCSYKFICVGGCRASAFMIKNDFFGEDKQMCTFFKGGYFEKFKEIIKKNSLLENVI